ncbi:uncharacterized protein Dana_GF24746 [Drosophila ananassae]|uniref:Kazal-like domain-containing protein n=1 Tax=Drosophila ananassae TaxID=7217 RepID=B3M8Z6_DROAN|nr:uncharacterized protein LOC6507377 [Drosophila ananassae]EDV38940.1 uncharacterized protein Dana_GF24746 [Drosophila ananassae]
MTRFGIILVVCCLWVGCGQGRPQIFGGNDPFLNPWNRQPTGPVIQPTPPTQGDDASSTTTTARPTTPSPRYLACLQTCPATSEYNPICGSDNIVYYNENKFNCAVFCGQNVQRLRNGIC